MQFLCSCDTIESEQERGVGMSNIIWFVGVVIFGVIEAATAQLVSIWLAGGAVCALIASLCGANGITQTVIFIAASAILLLFTRPVVKHLTEDRKTATNVDALIGKTAVITRALDGINDGEAKVDGKYWTVRSRSGMSFKEGDMVRICSVEGVKLIVAMMPECEIIS